MVYPLSLIAESGPCKHLYKVGCGEMTKEESRLGTLREWKRWRKANGVGSGASGNDALRFYSHLQSNCPDLLGFKSSRNKWQVVHDWLLSTGQVHD
jgi:hypothetical protein